MRRKLKATRSITLEEAAILRKQGLIFKPKNVIEEENQKILLLKHTESDFCKKMKILDFDFYKYRDKYFEKGEKGLRSILTRHGFRKEKSDCVVYYMKNKYAK